MACRRPALKLLKPPITVFTQQVRALNLHQHQSQALLDQSGVPIPRGRVARTPDEVRDAVQELGTNSILNSQVLNLRRKSRHGLQPEARGSSLCAKSPDNAKLLANQMFGTHHSSSTSNGIDVKKIYVSENPKYDELWYLAMTIDREKYCPAIVLSKKGGTDIRTIADESPDSVWTFDFGLTGGITDDVVSAIKAKANLSSTQTKNLTKILKAMHSIFASKDGMLLEIPSLAVDSTTGALTAIDSNFTFDDDASKRQKELFALRDTEQEVSDEVAAEQYGLVYIRMDGNIGNVVNGAGLAMATNDAIGLHGGKSANFLDAGGQATTQTMMQAFNIILKDPRVTAILVNIYGGITRCDMIAESIIGAANEIDIKVPMVVRLQGTNSAAGLKLVEEANLGLHVESDFGKAAQKAVELANAAR